MACTLVASRGLAACELRTRRAIIASQPRRLGCGSNSDVQSQAAWRPAGSSSHAAWRWSCNLKPSPTTRRCTPARALPEAAAAMTAADLVTPFLWFNTLITYAWVLLILAPRWGPIQRVMRSDAVVVLPALASLFFFVSAAVIDAATPEQLGAKVVFLFTEAITDPAKMATLCTPAYIAQDWVHKLVWDFVVGRMIYLDALQHDLPVRLSLLLTFNAGPPGLLVHLAIKAAVGMMRKREREREQGGR